jgi:hypothetical protein
LCAERLGQINQDDITELPQGAHRAHRAIVG